MGERRSRCSPSTIQKVLGDQKVDVFFMFFLDGYTGSLREHSLMTFLDFGSPKEAMGNQNWLFGAIWGAQRRKKGTLFLKGSQERPWEGFKEIWNGFGRYVDYVFGHVFNGFLV